MVAEDRFDWLLTYGFHDLLLCEDFAERTVVEGDWRRRERVPDELASRVSDLLSWCEDQYQSTRSTEFGIDVGSEKCRFRITAFPEASTGRLYFVRRGLIEWRNFAQLGFSQALTKHLLDRSCRGGVYIIGDTGEGKTSTGVSLVGTRLSLHGGLGLSIEKPVETNLNGVHGDGRCVVLEAATKAGEYGEQISRALRAGTGIFHLAEIRCQETAYEAISTSLMGKFVVATSHGASPGQGLERIARYAALNARSSIESTASALADGLTAVIWQRLVVHPGREGNPIIQSRTLHLNGENQAGVRSSIRRLEFDRVDMEVNRQRDEAIHAESQDS